MGLILVRDSSPMPPSKVKEEKEEEEQQHLQVGAGWVGEPRGILCPWSMTLMQQHGSLNLSSC